MHQQRRLAAILVADVVGYSRLIGQDESRTLRRIKAVRREVVDPNIAEYRGRVVKTTGDGILIEYPSAVEAVGCAVAIQRTMAERNAEMPVDQRIELRVGVHEGDIVVDDQDIFGDGVNVAARLEALSEPAGICISGRVYEDLAGRLELPFEDRGEQQLKNIARPVRIFSLGREAITGLTAVPRLQDEPHPTDFSQWFGTAPSAWLRTRSVRWAVVLVAALSVTGVVVWQSTGRHGAPGQVRAGLAGAPPAQPRGPTLAVLPFDNLSGDPNQEFYSDGISEELITVLSRFDQLRVLARNTTFAYKKKTVEMQELGRQLQAQYVIEGSFRRVPDQISVTAQLIDTRTGTHVWAQSYERPTTSTSLLSIQNDIAQHIGAAVGDIRTGAVAKAELERARAKPAAELSSYECVLQGYQASAAQSAAEPMRRARACLEATVKRDPTYAEAWAILTRVLQIQHSWGTGLDDNDKGIDVPRILEAANRAVELAPENAVAHFALFFAYSVTCQTERMRVETDRVLAINPNDANALGLMGSLLAYAGDWDYGRKLAEKGLALAGPAAPSWWWWVVAKDYYRKGEYAKALEVFQRSYSEQNWLDRLHLVYTLPHLGRIDEARAQIPALMKLKPDISVREADRLYASWCFDADFRDRMVKALRLAGLPEEADANRLRQGDATAPQSQR